MIYRFTNTLTGTAPKIIHYPGAKNSLKRIAIEGGEDWNKICNYFSRKKQDVELPSNITVVTFNNSSWKSLLEKNLNALDIKHHVLGKSLNNWKNPNKISLLVDFLPNIKTEYTMVLDAYDVLLVNNMKDIITDFESFGSMILFNATYGTYPEDKKGLYCNMEKSLKPNDFFCYLNSGCFLGKTDYVKYLYNLALSHEDNVTKKYHYSDQIKIKKFYVEKFPEIQIDSKCKIFQVLGWKQVITKPKML